MEPHLWSSKGGNHAGSQLVPGLRRDVSLVSSTLDRIDRQLAQRRPSLKTATPSESYSLAKSFPMSWPSKIVRRRRARKMATRPMASASPSRNFRRRRDDFGKRSVAAYVKKQNVLALRDLEGNLLAVIEIVSPGNKSSKSRFQQFLDKSTGLLAQGVHLMVIDLFPPTSRDPQGIHQAISSCVVDAFDFHPDKSLTLASYLAGCRGHIPRSFVEPVAVGDVLPAMPLFDVVATSMWIWNGPMPRPGPFGLVRSRWRRRD